MRSDQLVSGRVDFETSLNNKNKKTFRFSLLQIEGETNEYILFK